jgi:hypothetical protein
VVSHLPELDFRRESSAFFVMSPNAPIDVSDPPAHIFELAFHYPFPFEAVNHIAAIQKRSKPVYESCEVTHATVDDVDIVTYRAAVPWYLRYSISYWLLKL